MKKGGLATLKLSKPRRPGTSKPPRPKAGKLIDPNKAEGLPGTIQGKRASAPEVILAQVLDKYQKKYAFRFEIPAISGVYGLRGQKEVDFVISDTVLKPVQVDDTTFVHRSPEAKEEDAESDRVVNDFFKDRGGVPVTRIDALFLINIAMADFKARELGLV